MSRSYSVVCREHLYFNNCYFIIVTCMVTARLIVRKILCFNSNSCSWDDRMLLLSYLFAFGACVIRFPLKQTRGLGDTSYVYVKNHDNSTERPHVDSLSTVQTLVAATTTNALGTVIAKASLYLYLQRLGHILNGTVNRLTRLQLTILLPWCTLILLVKLRFVVSHGIYDGEIDGAGTTGTKWLSPMLQSYWIGKAIEIWMLGKSIYSLFLPSSEPHRKLVMRLLFALMILNLAETVVTLALECKEMGNFCRRQALRNWTIWEHFTSLAVACVPTLRSLYRPSTDLTVLSGNREARMWKPRRAGRIRSETAN